MHMSADRGIYAGKLRLGTDYLILNLKKKGVLRTIFSNKYSIAEINYCSL